jgi:hypothetical protein
MVKTALRVLDQRAVIAIGGDVAVLFAGCPWDGLDQDDAAVVDAGQAAPCIRSQIVAGRNSVPSASGSVH